MFFHSKNKLVLTPVAILVLLGGIFLFVQFFGVDNANNQDSLTGEDTAEVKADTSVIPAKEAQSILIGDGCVDVELALTLSEKVNGLSNRPLLEPGSGMLFVYSQDGDHRIWMKEMNFSIDIIWLDASRHVIHFEENVSPETYPKSFSSDDPSRYVLEVPAGFVGLNNIQEDEKAVFQSQLCDVS